MCVYWPSGIVVKDLGFESILTRPLKFLYRLTKKKSFCLDRSELKTRKTKFS